MARLKFTSANRRWMKRVVAVRWVVYVVKCTRHYHAGQQRQRENIVSFLHTNWKKRRSRNKKKEKRWKTTKILKLKKKKNAAWWLKLRWVLNNDRWTHPSGRLVSHIVVRHVFFLVFSCSDYWEETWNKLFYILSCFEWSS